MANKKQMKRLLNQQDQMIQELENELADLRDRSFSYLTDCIQLAQQNDLLGDRLERTLDLLKNQFLDVLG